MDLVYTSLWGFWGIASPGNHGKRYRRDAYIHIGQEEKGRRVNKIDSHVWGYGICCTTPTAGLEWNEVLPCGERCQKRALSADCEFTDVSLEQKYFSPVEFFSQEVYIRVGSEIFTASTWFIRSYRQYTFFA